MDSSQKVGLIAGRGNLPFEVLAEIAERGKTPVVVGLTGEAAPGLAARVEKYRQVDVGKLGEIIEFFKKETVAELVFAGKVGKEALFSGGFDSTFQQLLHNLPQKNDDAILLALVLEFEKNGIKVARQTEYMQNLLAKAGPLVGEITPAEQADIKLGFEMAKAIGGLDIGQSVVVKQGVVLAVEAIEGTDQAIIRGGTLGGPGAVVVKVSKPEQDERFDVPTIGRKTIESMATVNARVLGIEAGKTLVTERDELIRLANQNKIKIVAV